MEDRMFLVHAFVIAVLVIGAMSAPAQSQSAKPAARKSASGPAKPAQQLFYDGFEAYKANHFPDAIRLFEQGLRQDATNALAAFYLGEAYAKTGNPAKAQEWYAASLAADPQSEVAAQARERLAAAQRAVTPPNPAPATKGPSFEETVAFIREKLGIYGHFHSRGDEYSVTGFDMLSNDISIEDKADLRGSAGQHIEYHYHKYKFSVFDILKFSLSHREYDGVRTIKFICIHDHYIQDHHSVMNAKNGPWKEDKKISQVDIGIPDENQAEKLLKAFEHLFTLRGWQEKKDLF
jgi:tetratricopeptide (TPR) repeat protein